MEFLGTIGRQYAKALLLCSLVAVSTASPALAEDVEFSSTVAETCSIYNVTNGILGARADYARIASGQPGGVDGGLTVLATGPGFQLTITAPSGFNTEPLADAASPERMRAWHRGSGANNYNWRRTSRNLNVGATDVEVRLQAQKLDGSVFANGSYTATVVMTCE